MQVNLLKNTLSMFKFLKISESDILYVTGTDDNGHIVKMSWNDFKPLMDVTYDENAWKPEINPTLQIICKDFWLNRETIYDDFYDETTDDWMIHYFPKTSDVFGKIKIK